MRSKPRQWPDVGSMMVDRIANPLVLSSLSVCVPKTLSVVDDVTESPKLAE
jgi:hypothetical protein